MGLATGIVLPNDGDRIVVNNYNDPIQKILAQLNGNLDDTNITSLSGSKISSGSLPIGALAESVAAGWFPSSDPLTYASNNGNKEYTVTTPTDKTSKYSPGMRIKVSRTGTTPTTCADLERDLSQYASRVSASVSGITFTDDFTVEAWVKLESYTNAEQRIITRLNSTGTNGWSLSIDAAGRVVLAGQNAANYKYVASYQAIPTGVWVHVAATLDLSGSAGTVYINGTLVPSSITNSGSPVSLVQGTDLVLGNFTSGTQYFDGKISEVRLWASIRTAQQIRDNMNVQLTGTEGMVGLWQLDETSGTIFNDSTSNGNHLTAAGGLTAGAADNPFNSTEYGIITKVAYSSPNTTITVFTGTDYNLPNGTLSNFQYSTQKSPFGFNAARGKWRVDAHVINSQSTTITVNGTWVSTNIRITVPTGEWVLGYQGSLQSNSTVNSTRSTFFTLSNGAPTNSVYNQMFTTRLLSSASQQSFAFSTGKNGPVTTTTATDYTLYATSDAIAGTETAMIRGDQGSLVLLAECAYI